MDRKQAIEAIKKWRSVAINSQCSDNEENAFDMAIAALEHGPKPEALTLERLREMMKEPLKHWVWIENLTSPEGSGYMRNHGDWSNGRYFCCGWPGTGYSFVYELYGKSWLAYPTKPETEGD